jgi:hypothetical protein
LYVLIIVLEMNPQIAIDIDHDSVLLGWEKPSCTDVVLAFELQMTSSKEVSEEDWISLSTTIKGTSIRKKNLSPDLKYWYDNICRIISF